MTRDILASRIAFSLHKPLSYIVPEKEKKNNSSPEVENFIPQNKKIIFVTDVVVTYYTMESIIKQYCSNNVVIAIYCVFFRKNDLFTVNPLYVNMTYCLNNSFDIELVLKNGCKYSKCIAQNRTINSIYVNEMKG